MNGEKNQKAKHVYGTVWPFSLSLDKANQYVFVDDAFTAEECRKIISIRKQKSLLDAKVKNSNKINKVRDSKVSWITGPNFK